MLPYCFGQQSQNNIVLFQMAMSLYFSSDRSQFQTDRQSKSSVEDLGEDIGTHQEKKTTESSSNVKQ